MKKVKRTQPCKGRGGKWIPISKRQSEWFQDVLVQYQNGKIDIDYITDKGFTFEGLYGKVIAWMPLPEPYKK